MPKSFQPLSFHLQIVLFFVVFEPPGGAKTTLRERGHLKKSPSSTTCVLSTQRFWWGSRKLTPSRDVCTACVCVLGRPVCVFAWLFGYEIFTQKRGEKKLEAGSPSSSPPTVLFIQESHFERLGEKETTWHTQSTTRKKKRFFKKSEIKKRSSVYYKRVGILSLLLLHAARELKLKRRRNVFVPHFGWWLVFFFFISNLF